MNKSSSYAYFFIQGLAWGLVFLHQVVIALVLQNYSTLRTSVVFLSIFVAFLLTHLYRFWAKKLAIFDLSIKKQVLCAVSFMVLFAIISGVFSYSLSNYLLYNKLPHFLEVRFVAIVSTWLILYAIWLLAYHLFYFFETLKQQSNRYWQIEKSLQARNNEILQLQMNPHFLFNALNSIRALILFDPPKAKEATQILRELLLEGYISIGVEMISLQQELDIVEKYIALEKLRFGDKLSFQVVVEAVKPDTQVPAGVLLTLAENAVKHGFKQGQTSNNISLSIKKTSHQKIQIQSINPGMYEQNPIVIQNKYAGIGLENLKNRLANYFSSFYLQIKNLQNNQVAVEVMWQSDEY